MRKWIIRILVGGFLAGLLTIVVFYLLIVAGAFGPMPSKHALEKLTNETASVVYASNGERLGKFYVRNRTDIHIDSLPDYVKNTLVATEDERFYKHQGVDTRSLFRVLIKTVLLSDESGGGGSTITQQLAKNIFGRRTFGKLTIPVNKVKEIILAKRLEDIYEKDQIIELYLNTVPFGENVYGIEAASQRFFNKSAQDLKIEEAAVLIGMLKANTSYSPRLHPERSKQRRNVVMLQLKRNNYITEEEYNELIQLPLVIDYANIETIGIADYFLNRVKTEATFIIEKYNKLHIQNLELETSGLTIETTLDPSLQRSANKAMEKHLSKMQTALSRQYASGASAAELNRLAKDELARNNQSERASSKTKITKFTWDGIKLDSGTVIDSIKYQMTVLNGGMFAMSPKDGAVKVYVGGVDFRTQPYDQIQARRQMASGFKPILYAAGLKDGTMPCDYLSNEHVVLEDFQDWSPGNYDKDDEGGRYSMQAALSKSLNIPTLHLYFQVGHNKLNRLWEDFDFKVTLPENPSAALGTAEGNMIEVAKAYATFANGGNLVEPYYITKITTKEGDVIYEHEQEKSKEILSEEEANLMRQMLEKTVDAGTAIGLKSRFGVTADLAGKTGTSQNYADAWFNCFSPDLVLINRVGCASPAVHFNTGTYGSGSALALPLAGYFWKDIQSTPELKTTYLNGFDHSNDPTFGCEDYRPPGLIDGVFNLFSKDKTTIEKERRKAEVKQGIRKGIRSIFGDDE